MFGCLSLGNRDSLPKFGFNIMTILEQEKARMKDTNYLRGMATMLPSETQAVCKTVTARNGTDHHRTFLFVFW